MNNITLPADWEPVGRYSSESPTEADFQGVLDGQGYTIDLTAVPADKQTIFYDNYGTVKNLRLVGGYTVFGSYYEDWADGLLAEDNYGTIECCSVEGDIELRVSGTYGVSLVLGGMVGDNFPGGVIRNCYALVSISVNKNKGSGSEANYASLVGRNNGAISNCYAVGNCYSVYQGYVSRGGGVTSNGLEEGKSCSGCYYNSDLQVSAQPVLPGEWQVGKSTVAMKMQASYTGWDFNNIWYISSSMNDGYPVLRCDKRFSIPAGSTSSGGTTSGGGSTSTGGSVSTPNTTGGIRVLVNGRQLSFDQPPVAMNNRVLVPMRAIFEALGATVEWNPEKQTILGNQDRDKVTILLELDVPMMAKQVNGGAITFTELDVAPTALNNRTLVPVRVIAETFGCDVQWDGATQTVTITE